MITDYIINNNIPYLIAIDSKKIISNITLMLITDKSIKNYSLLILNINKLNKGNQVKLLDVLTTNTSVLKFYYDI